MSATLLHLPLLKPIAPQPGPRPGINYPQAKQGYVEMGARCWECPLVKMRPVRTEWYGEGEPSLALVGEAPGRREAAINRPFCLVPETLVLMADLNWKPLGEVRIGDQILTVEENARRNNKGASGSTNRYWQIATVTATHRSRAKTTRVTTADSELIGTGDHRVMIYHGRIHHKKWRRIDQLRKLSPTKRYGSQLVFTAKPWSMLSTYDSGWLGGFFDGEGHVTGSRSTRRSKSGTVGFSQNRGPTCESAVAKIKALGFKLRAKEEGRAKGVVCERFAIRGGLIETARFLGLIRPERLIAHFRRVADRVCVRALPASRVQTLTPAGEREVVDITTTAGTFIANGFVVHNCGASGKLLNYACAQGGVPRGDLAILNAIACGPIPSEADAIKASAARACRPRLLAELRRLRPRGILAVGAYALRSLVDEKQQSGVMALRGALLKLTGDYDAE